jgi:8-oxo-dGTP pyrophosphatase MutT (NUDIX family)
MSKAHGPWTIRHSTQRFKGLLFEVWHAEVTRPDGQPGTYDTLRVNPGVAILALDDEGHVHLAEDFRYAIGRKSIEAASGAIDQGEEPEAAARRELREELGIEAADLLPLGRVEPMTSLACAPTHLFLARGLRFTEPEPEGTETIQRVRLPFSEALRRVMEGTITDAATCAVLLKAARHLGIP